MFFSVLSVEDKAWSILKSKSKENTSILDDRKNKFYFCLKFGLEGNVTNVWYAYEYLNGPYISVRGGICHSARVNAGRMR